MDSEKKEKDKKKKKPADKQAEETKETPSSGEEKKEPCEAKEERELSREEALRYLGGEVLEGGMRGWGVLRYRRCALGWGKGSGGQIKNHYPKGLRWR